MKTAFCRIGLAILVTFTSTFSLAQEKVRVAAASDVKFALDSIISVFDLKSSASVVVSYGSSGKLFEQISNGAPFDIFFSADVSYPEKLEKKLLVQSTPEIYGTGRIVLWSRLTDPSILKMEILLAGNVKRIAIANPQHAPYGKRAVESLQYYKLYDEVKGKLVLGENISQAAQYLYSGSADVGIIALSLALSPPMQKLAGKFYLIPEESHDPLHQAFVLLKPAGSRSEVKEFFEFLKTPEAKNIFRHYGFNLPAEILK
jgi:molybdate transport system substrate-binding protein